MTNNRWIIPNWFVILNWKSNKFSFSHTNKLDSMITVNEITKRCEFIYHLPNILVSSHFHNYQFCNREDRKKCENICDTVINQHLIHKSDDRWFVMETMFSQHKYTVTRKLEMRSMVVGSSKVFCTQSCFNDWLWKIDRRVALQMMSGICHNYTIYHRIHTIQHHKGELHSANRPHFVIYIQSIIFKIDRPLAGFPTQFIVHWLLP